MTGPNVTGADASQHNARDGASHINPQIPTPKGSESLVERLRKELERIEAAGTVVYNGETFTNEQANLAAIALSSAEGGGSSARTDSATRVASQLCDTEAQNSAGLRDAVSEAVSLADIAVTYDSIGRQYTHVTNADEIASAIISIVAARTPATGFAALAEEFSKPQFMTTTSGFGKHSLAFTFHGDDGRGRRDALHNAIRLAASAVNS